jgi:hypothetical protein
MMMIVLIGVMGAGLLTFVSSDLNSVIEENRGQRAFELADAGVAAAKRQLTSHCGSDPDCELLYDGVGTPADIRWSTFYPGLDGGGMTLTDLDGSATTPNEVNVAIEYRDGTDDFKVISEGTYGVARRKIEAIFELTETAGVGSTPAFYSRSDITLEKRVAINGVSLFSERNITIKDFDVKNSPLDFQRSYERDNTISKDVLNINDPFTCLKDALGNCVVKDELGDWDIEPWNTTGRKGVTPYPEYPALYPSSTERFEGVGFAAEGKICGSSSCQNDDPSVADGVYGYDCTTGEYASAGCPDTPDTSSSPPRGNKLTFVDKDDELGPGGSERPNADVSSDVISYPFERTIPDPVRLKQLALDYPDGADLDPGKYWPDPPPNADRWNQLFDAASKDSPKVVFVDGDGTGVDFQGVPEENAYGILVVWCGKLTLKGPFKGIIITLHGDNNELPGNTNCDPGKGGFVSEGQKITGYAYTEGHIGGDPGIHLKENSVLNPFTGPGRDALLGYAFGEGDGGGGGTSTVQMQGWRELYE